MPTDSRAGTPRLRIDHDGFRVAVSRGGYDGGHGRELYVDFGALRLEFETGADALAAARAILEHAGAARPRRLCFELTLVGFSRLAAASTAEGELLQNRLVKWVIAPSGEAVQAFIRRHSLTLECLPRAMFAAAGDYTFEDGVDLFLDPDGTVVAGDPTQVDRWPGDSLLAMALPLTATGGPDGRV